MARCGEKCGLDTARFPSSFWIFPACSAGSRLHPARIKEFSESWWKDWQRPLERPAAQLSRRRLTRAKRNRRGVSGLVSDPAVDSVRTTCHGWTTRTSTTCRILFRRRERSSRGAGPETARGISAWCRGPSSGPGTSAFLATPRARRGVEECPVAPGKRRIRTRDNDRPAGRRVDLQNKSAKRDYLFG